MRKAIYQKGEHVNTEEFLKLLRKRKKDADRENNDKDFII
jgi:hypothetical protein